jgi:hypothetical protein
MQLRKEAFPPLRDIEDTAQARYHFATQLESVRDRTGRQRHATRPRALDAPGTTHFPKSHLPDATSQMRPLTTTGAAGANATAHRPK